MAIHARKDSSADRKRQWRPGLTLVEVLAVVIILGLLATVLTTSFQGQVGRAKVELARTGIGVVVNAVETYALETGEIPSTSQGLGVLTETPPGRGQPFITADKLLDPWKNPYVYVAPGPNSPYLIVSYGADGQQGGEPGSPVADVTSDDLDGRAR